MATNAMGADAQSSVRGDVEGFVWLGSWMTGGLFKAGCELFVGFIVSVGFSAVSEGNRFSDAG